MKKIIVLTAFALFASAPAVQSAPAVTQDLRATDFSSIKEVDPKPQDKQKGKQSRKSKGGPSSGVEAISIKEVDPAPQGKLRGIKAGKSKGGPSSGADEVGFNPQPDPPGIDKKKLGKKVLGAANPPDADKGGLSSEYEEIAIKEVDPAPQGKLRGIKAGKSKGGPSSGADEVGFNPQPDPPGVDKKKKLSKKTFGVVPPPEGDTVSGPSPHMNTPRLDTPRFSVPSLGGAGGARVR